VLDTSQSPHHMQSFQLKPTNELLAVLLLEESLFSSVVRPHISFKVLDILIFYFTYFYFCISGVALLGAIVMIVG
jgi:hypothetical protein